MSSKSQTVKERKSCDRRCRVCLAQVRLGILEVPSYPTGMGDVSTFKGGWRHDVELRGKRVAVIGNGFSVCVLV